jgi:hypothetical protein
MEKLRFEIRAAFEREQYAHPPIPTLRRDVVAAVTAQSPRRQRNYQWLALAAALVLAILVVVGLMSSRFAPRASVPVNPKTPPVADLGPPPTGVPLLYYYDAVNPSWLVGLDWSGKHRGLLKLDEPRSVVEVAPDGQFFLSTSKNGTVDILDRLAKPVPMPSGVTVLIPGNWADDNRHRCGASLDQKTSDWTLSTQLPGEAAKPVTIFALATPSSVIPPSPKAGQPIQQPIQSIVVASCSFRNDQAILFRMGAESSMEVWVVRLSDGKTVGYNIPSTLGIVSSSDGTYIAENANDSVPAPNQTGSLKETRIRRVSDWSVVATIPQAKLVMAFSGDDSLVLVTTAQFRTDPTATSLVDWRSGRTVWTNPGPRFVAGIKADPGGSSFALTLTDGKQADPGANPAPMYDVLIVHRDGTVIAVPGRYWTTW